jgi:hypothetical protein
MLISLLNLGLGDSVVHAADLAIFESTL